MTRTKKGSGRGRSLRRSAGILLHPTSLHTEFGIGDLGPSAYEFVDFLEKSGQSFWQVLPLGPTGYGDSPYQVLSTFAGNPNLISPDKLVDMKLLPIDYVKTIADRALTEPTKDTKDTRVLKINYSEVIERKSQILKTAFKTFKEVISEGNNVMGKDLQEKFNRFNANESSWLDEFVLFYSLKRKFNLQSWISWPEEYGLRLNDSEALKNHIEVSKDDLMFYCFVQWVFFTQWHELKKYANSKSISIIGDMPIFVAHDSADVWANSKFFTLNSDGSVKFQAGVPPDYFSATGQLWGNPLYKWKEMKKTGYKWFIMRFKKLMELVDWIRIDHFRGFEAYWCVPGHEKTAVNGEWIKTPGKELFRKIRKKLGTLPVIAEDLGVITKEVENLRDKFHFPGMRVLQFAFGGDGTNPHLPHNYAINSVVYTGTHDNNTTLGWWENEANYDAKNHLKDYFDTSAVDINETLIKGIYRSIAKCAIVPIQDILKMGTEARMNRPGDPGGNWQFQLAPNLLTSDTVNYLASLVKSYRREGCLTEKN